MSQEEKDILEGIVLDITDLSEYLKDLFNFFPAPTIYVTPAGVILESNRSFEKLVGIKKEEVIGERINSFFEKGKAEEIVKKTVKRREIKNKEFYILSRKKGKVPVSVSSRLREGEEGPVGFFLSAIDITKIKKIEEELKEINIVLEIRVRARTRRAREFVERLEETVEKRTKELQEKLRDLQRFYELTKGRESRLKELILENQKLKKRFNFLKKEYAQISLNKIGQRPSEG